MSARKSYDVEARRPNGEKPKRRKRRKASTEPAPKRRKTLRARRQEARGQKHTVVLAVLALAALGVVYGLWQPEIRLTEVSALETPDKEGIETIAKGSLTGTYYSVLPRNSFFLYSERSMRTAILEAYPSISALSIRRTGWNSLAITASSRQSAFLWCGTPGEAGISDTASCYETDAEGFVFAPAVPEDTTEGVALLKVYALLDAASSTDTYPLRAKVEGAEQLPDILRFARVITSLGIPLRAVGIRSDEADLYSAGGTRITYVVGKEREAVHIAESTFSKLNFMDGSVEYVDLRFGGKAYIKRRE
jgi:hypothetical protein